MSAVSFLDLRALGNPHPPAVPQSASKSQLRGAAEAFEAILVRRLLESAKAGSFAGDSPFSGPGVEQFETMRNEQFADLAASRGTFGIADAIERQLAAIADPRVGNGGG